MKKILIKYKNIIYLDKIKLYIYFFNYKIRYINL